MALELNELTKRYGAKTALDRVSLRLEQGVYGLLGPNGAGKSTLMNILSGNLSADSGSVTYGGVDIAKLGRDYRAVLGFMPQQLGLYQQFTGFRFLSYIAALKGMDRRRAAQEIEEIAALVNLSDVLHRRVGAYSGGMKQRLLIAQAVLNSPEILILDEPTAGLDPKERIRIRNLISEISSDKIVLLATHVVSDVESIGKEVILLKKGKVVKQDTPQNLLASLRGRVYELTISPEQLAQVEREFLVSNVSVELDRFRVRVVADQEPQGYACCEAAPTLEEEYLYVFADEVG
jgi:ABC-2 type transport system ATP-binding protein